MIRRQVSEIAGTSPAEAVHLFSGPLAMIELRDEGKRC